VVPRAWTIYFAEMAGAELPDALPEAWIEEAERELGSEVPSTLSEPSVSGRAPRETVMAVVADVKRSIFPHHGISG
jgi:hypothetical protein